MPTLNEIELAVAQVTTDSGKLHSIVHGGPTVVVVTEGGNVPSVAKAIADIAETIQEGYEAGFVAVAANEAARAALAPAQVGQLLLQLDTGILYKGTALTAGSWSVLIQMPLPVAQGGTGASTAIAARAALLPALAGKAGQALVVKEDGSDVEFRTLGNVLQMLTKRDTSVVGGAASLPWDGTIPQVGEMVAYPQLNLTVTPKSVGSRLLVRATLQIAVDSATTAAVALFKDSDASAIGVRVCAIAAGSLLQIMEVDAELITTALTPITFKPHYGTVQAAVYTRVNNQLGANYLGILSSRITVTELAQ
jgi:hypothetical protein